MRNNNMGASASSRGNGARKFVPAGKAYQPMDSIKNKPARKPFGGNSKRNDFGKSDRGGFKPRSDRGEFRPRREGSFGQKREGGFAPRREGNYAPKREGSFAPRREFGPRDFLATADAPRSENRGSSNRGGFRVQRSESPRFGGETRSQGRGNFRRSEGGSQRSFGGGQRSFGDRQRSYGNGGGNRRRGGGRRQQSSSRIHPGMYISKSQGSETVTEVKSEPVEKVVYSSFGFEKDLSSNIQAKGYQHATPIQAQTIPLVMQGKNVMGISSTGSGKTAAFLAPLINKIMKDNSQKLLVLAPTRELAMQIQKEAISMIKGTSIRATLVIGGESMYRQAQELRRRPQIIIGTPGRLIDVYNRGYVQFKDFTNVVLDEVDRMLDMGFIPDVREIFSYIPNERQTLFFSATIENSVKKIVGELAESYETITISENKPIHTVKQDIIEYTSIEDKMDKLDDLLTSEGVAKSIVFVETKHFADKVEKMLRERGHSVAVLHGGKTQSRRSNVIKMYKDNKFTILVATNVAARGLDISDISHVINFDEPQTYDEYIHRIGRTGRNGKSGTAYTFVSAN